MQEGKERAVAFLWRGASLGRKQAEVSLVFLLLYPRVFFLAMLQVFPAPACPETISCKTLLLGGFLPVFLFFSLSG